MREILAQVFRFDLAGILSLLCLLLCIIASLVKGKNMKLILFLVFGSNLSIALSYLIGGQGINGAASCFLGAAQAVINYFFESKGKPLPKWLICIHMASFVAVNLVVGMSGGFDPLCLLAIAACLTFVMEIGQENGAKYRFWVICNSVLWCAYDILSKAWPSMFTHICLLLFTVIGMIIHDRKTKKEVEK